MRQGPLDAIFHAAYIGPRILPGTPGATGGGETQVALVARELARRGRRIGIALLAEGGLPDSVDGIRLVAQRPSRPLRAVGPLLELVSIVRALWPVKADTLVQSGAGPSLAYLGLLAKLRRRRLVYSISSRLELDFRRHAASAATARLFHLGIRLCDEIVAENAEQAELCRQRLRRDPVVIPHIAEQAPARSSEPEFFLWVGRLHPIKRPHDYVELARRLPDLRFKMIASLTSGHRASMAEPLRRAAVETPNLELLEPRPREELGTLFEQAVAIVNTSEHEGMPNVFLEGWSRGVPVLALHHDPGGVISRRRLGGFAAGSMARFAQLTAQMWHARKDQGELAKRCQSYVRKRHSAEVVAAAWERVLWPGGRDRGVARPGLYVVGAND